MLALQQECVQEQGFHLCRSGVPLSAAAPTGASDAADGGFSRLAYATVSICGTSGGTLYRQIWLGVACLHPMPVAADDASSALSDIRTFPPI